jgi:DNA-binding CsgD family transcriptional regulator
MALNRQADGTPFNRSHGTCARCGRPGELRARGLDINCYEVARGNGTLIDYGRRTRPLAETVEEVRHLVAGGAAPEEVAQRLGITPETLRVTLHRAERRGLIDRRRALPVAFYARNWAKNKAAAR